MKIRFRQHRQRMRGGAPGGGSRSRGKTQAEKRGGRRSRDRYTCARQSWQRYARMRSHRRAWWQLLGVHLLQYSWQVLPLLQARQKSRMTIINNHLRNNSQRRPSIAIVDRDIAGRHRPLARYDSPRSVASRVKIMRLHIITYVNRKADAKE